VPSTDLAPWTCPTCGANATTPFCGRCGEQRLGPADLSLRHYAAAAAESLFSWDGRILGTLASFIRRPGELAAAYLHGRRKPFLTPLQLFLLINVIFFVQQGITRWNTYSTPFQVHVEQSRYADFARAITRVRFDQLGLPFDTATLAAFATRFNAAVSLSAKSLVILIVPFVTLLVAAVRLARPRQAAVHLTVGFHLTAYLLALQTVVLPVLSGGQWLAAQAGRPLDWGVVDTVGTWALRLGFAVIAVPVFERVYGSARRWAVLQALVTAFFVFDCVQAYRIVLFVLTLFSTS
jgi:hypothetical protein